MESGVIVYAFLLAGFLTFCGLFLFFLVNRRDSKLDNSTYDDAFDPSSMVKKYHQKNADKDSHEVLDPTNALKRYAEPINSPKKKIKKKLKKEPKKQEPKQEQTQPSQKEAVQKIATVEIEVDLEKYAPPAKKAQMKLQTKKSPSDKAEASNTKGKPSTEDS